MKILFLVPDGVGIRNYLYSNVLSELSSLEHEIIIGHTLSPEALLEVEKIHLISFRTVALPKYKESILEKFLRESISFARLKYNSKVSNNETILDNWSPSRNKISLKIFYFIIELFGSASSSYNWIKKLEKIYKNIFVKANKLLIYEKFINEIEPDLIFNTHQRSINIIPILEASKKLNCKSVTVIYSWDNLPKARLNIKTNKYFVWSDYMKSSMNLYYPEINKTDIIVTGTPQFDFYKNKKFYISKKEFFKKHDLNISKKVICFSGDDAKTSPYDSKYLEDLAEQIDKLNTIDKPQVLFRRCPVDLSTRYDSVIKKYSHIIKVSVPLWNSDCDDDWSLIYPAFEDVKLLVNIALHCDSVYNVGSTMAHDFAMFNKPAMYINYDHKKEQNWKIKKIYNFEHFRSMKNMDAVVWINSKEEIANKLMDTLDNPNNVAKDRVKWLDIVNHRVDNTSKLIALEIDRM